MEDSPGRVKNDNPRTRSPVWQGTLVENIGALWSIDKHKGEKKKNSRFVGNRKRNFLKCRSRPAKISKKKKKHFSAAVRNTPGGGEFQSAKSANPMRYVSDSDKSGFVSPIR